MYLYEKRKLDAYMSVEAAFVVPAAVFGIVLIIYMAFMVYGRCILSQDVYILGFRAGLFFEEQCYGNAGEYVIDHADAQTGNRYFGSSKPNIEARQSGKNIRVEGSISTNHHALYGYFKDIPDLWESKAAAGIKLQRPAKTLRKIKRAKDLSGELLS